MNDTTDLPLRSVNDRALVRLIPATYHKPPALRGLVDDDAELALLAEVEAMTSARHTAERGRELAIDRRELAWSRREADLRLYGNTHVNAAFSYRRPGGNRFNDDQRGAWYCSWSALTSIAEVGYHTTRELSYIGEFNTTLRYVELLADFIGDFPDLSQTPDHPALAHAPSAGYPHGQALANELRAQGHRGLVYPSVRHPDGTCLVAFDPSAVQNVRPGAKWDITWSGSPDYDVIGL